MQAHRSYPLGQPGQVATYCHTNLDGLLSSVVQTFTVTIGSVTEQAGRMSQWLCLRATKANSETFAVWLLTERLPSEAFNAAQATVSRYILQIKEDTALEFRDKFTGKPVLPMLGAWQYLFPKSADQTTENALFPKAAKIPWAYLSPHGHSRFRRICRTAQRASPLSPS